MSSVLTTPGEPIWPENKPVEPWQYTIELVEELTSSTEKPVISRTQGDTILEEELTVFQEKSKPTRPESEWTPIIPEQDFGVDPKILCPLGCNNLLGLKPNDLRKHMKVVHSRMFAPNQDTVFCPLVECTIHPYDPIAPGRYYRHLSEHLLQAAGETVHCDQCNKVVLRENYDTHATSNKHRGIHSRDVPRKSVVL